jgi:hypothetical protein
LFLIFRTKRPLLDVQILLFLDPKDALFEFQEGNLYVLRGEPVRAKRGTLRAKRGTSYVLRGELYVLRGELVRAKRGTCTC